MLTKGFANCRRSDVMTSQCVKLIVILSTKVRIYCHLAGVCYKNRHGTYTYHLHTLCSCMVKYNCDAVVFSVYWFLQFNVILAITWTGYDCSCVPSLVTQITLKDVMNIDMKHLDYFGVVAQFQLMVLHSLLKAHRNYNASMVNQESIAL